MNNTAANLSESAESRRQPRTHLFVAATLYADGGSNPVHIRNMSQSGALIEGSVLPEVGYRVSLKRGPLQASGHIAWRVERRAGVKLDTSVHVSDWMSRLGSAGQERVDAMLSIVRNNSSMGSEEVPQPTQATSTEAELSALRSELMALESALTRDSILVATHPEIQTLDIAMQRIDRILKRLRTGG